MRTSTRASIRRFAIGAALLALGLSVDHPCQTPQNKEFELKAQMIRKMLPFVTWPKGTFVPEKTVITVGIIGEDPFGEIIDRLFKGSLIKGCRVTVVRIPSWQNTKDRKRVLACHALFVARSEKKSLADIIPEVAKHPILLMSDSPGFASLGTHINFFVASSKVAFETQAESAQRAGVRISSKLIRLGRRVE